MWIYLTNTQLGSHSTLLSHHLLDQKPDGNSDGKNIYQRSSNVFFHKCLKMPKGYSETVKRRWINNTIGVFADLISDVIFTNLYDNKQILVK